MQKIGVLALQGGVAEHVSSLKLASGRSGIAIDIVEVRTKREAEGLDGLILPGGESTAISKLMEREGLFGAVLGIRKIMGTCAGAVMLAKKVDGALLGQKFLGLMDIEISRNAYGSQLSSFEAEVETDFGKMNGVFIRAPKFVRLGKNVKAIARLNTETVGAYQKEGERHFIALAFHPELFGTLFHEFFLKL